MSTPALAEVMLKMLQDEDFAKSLLDDPRRALEPYRTGLTAEEIAAVSKRIDPAQTEKLLETPHLGGWNLLAEKIDEIPSGLRAQLNSALAHRSTQSTAIPVTGQ